jgi:hypothetical protein
MTAFSSYHYNSLYYLFCSLLGLSWFSSAFLFLEKEKDRSFLKKCSLYFAPCQTLRLYHIPFLGVSRLLENLIERNYGMIQQMLCDIGYLCRMGEIVASLRQCLEPIVSNDVLHSLRVILGITQKDVATTGLNQLVCRKSVHRTDDGSRDSVTAMRVGNISFQEHGKNQHCEFLEL